jgi:hypothetical protein
MQIRLPAHAMKPAYEARGWLGLLSATFLADLECTIRALERTHGPCEVDVETYVNPPRSLNVRRCQIDLLVCFRRIIAICEIKRHARVGGVDGAADQLRDQQTLIRTLLGSSSKDKGVYGYLFVPLLPQAGLETVIDSRWVATNDIDVSGSSSALRGLRGRRGTNLYFAESLLRLQQRPGLPPNSNIDRLKKAISEACPSFHRFSSFEELARFLSALPPGRQISRPRGHVPEVRQDECENALQMLERDGIVEIVGPPGIGKSSLVLDVQERWLEAHPEYQAVRLSPWNCRSEAELRDTIVTTLDGQSALDAESALRAALRQPRVLWAECCDARTAQIFRDLVRTLAAEGDASREARWILESHTSRFPRHSLEIQPLSSGSMHRILAEVEVPQFTTRDEIVEAARGNPRHALSLCEANGPALGQAPPSPTVGWVGERLSRAQKAALGAIVQLATRAPLGVPISAVAPWLRQVRPTLLPREAEEAVGSVVGMLRRLQLAHVESEPPLDAAAVGLDLLGALPELDDMLLSVDPGLVEVVKEDCDAQWSATEADNYLLEQLGADEAILHITLALHIADLGPFVRSTFRRTHLSVVLQWVERSGVEELVSRSPEQSAVFRCLRVLERMASHERVPLAEVRECLAELPAGSSIARFAGVVLEGVALGLDPAVTAADLDAWAGRCAAEPDDALRCEMEVRWAAALARVDRHADAWRVLTGCLARTQVGAGARSLALSYALSQLNRHKVQAVGLPTPGERQPLIALLAHELFGIGARTGNHGICGDAVFFLVRTKELALSRIQPFNEQTAMELLGLLPALEFVERVSPVRRTQAVLTQGSAHRHVARWEQVGLESFLPHATAALRLYLRVVQRSVPRGHVTFALNAASYALEVCLKLLRFPGGADDATVSRCSKQACAIAAQVLASTKNGHYTKQDEKLRSQTIQSHALVLWAATAHERGDIGALAAALELSLADVVHEISDKRQRQQQRWQALRAYLVNFRRARAFGDRSVEGRRYLADPRVLGELKRLLVDRAYDALATTGGLADEHRDLVAWVHAREAVARSTG